MPLLQNDIHYVKGFFPDANVQPDSAGGYNVWRRKTQEPLELPLGKGDSLELAWHVAAANADNKETKPSSKTIRDLSLSFSEALVFLKAGRVIRRCNWNVKGMWLVIVPGSDIVVEDNRPLSTILMQGTELSYQPHIDIFTAQGIMGPWSPTQADILAEDWEVV